MGLDAGDREIGVFAHFGLTCIQPYAAVADLYSRAPDSWIDGPDAKRQMNLPLVSKEVAALIPSSKMRAQTGDREGGVLGLFVEAGIGQDRLMTRWEEIYRDISNDKTLNPMIVVGRYRS